MKTQPLRLSLLIILVALPAVFLLLALKSVKEFEGLRPGDSLPRARLWSETGIAVETATWRDTLLVVFQPGCEACLREIDDLASIAPRFPKVKIVLLSTAIDVEGLQAPFPIYVDPAGGFVRKVRRLITPAVYFVDATGTIRYARTGRRSAAEEEQLLRGLLNEERGT
jgi:hypothetical protein